MHQCINHHAGHSLQCSKRGWGLARQSHHAEISFGRALIDSGTPPFNPYGRDALSGLKKRITFESKPSPFGGADASDCDDPSFPAILLYAV
jgi:hypothetical protein